MISSIIWIALTLVVMIWFLFLLLSFKSALHNHEGKWVGLITCAFFFYIVGIFLFVAIGKKGVGILGLGMFVGFLVMPLYWVGKHRRLQKRAEREELRQAQLESLRTGRTTVSIKGKMRKLK